MREDVLETLKGPERDAAVFLRGHVHPVEGLENTFRTDEVDPMDAREILPGMIALQGMVDTQQINSREALGVPPSIFRSLLGATVISAGAV